MQHDWYSNVRHWYWYSMYVTGTGTVCTSLVLVHYVRHWYWYSMYVTGTGTVCTSLVLVQYVRRVVCTLYSMYVTGTGSMYITGTGTVCCTRIGLRKCNGQPGHEYYSAKTLKALTFTSRICNCITALNVFHQELPLEPVMNIVKRLGN